MVWPQHYQCHTLKFLCSHPVPCNLHRNIIVILTPHRPTPHSHMPHDFSQSRSISRTLIAISADTDMAAIISKISNILPHFQNLPRISFSYRTFLGGAKYCLFCLIVSVPPFFLYIYTPPTYKTRNHKSI